MNAAIDQNCEKYITKNNLERQVEAKLQEVYDRNGFERPTYQGVLGGK